MQIKMQKCAKYMQESTKFNGKRNLGVMGYGLSVMGDRLPVTGYGLQVSLGHCRILNEELANGRMKYHTAAKYSRKETYKSSRLCGREFMGWITI